MFIHSESITTVKLINISTLPIVTMFLCVMNAVEIYSLSIFTVFNTVLLSTVITPVP